MKKFNRRDFIKLMSAGTAASAAGLTLPSILGRDRLAEAAEDYYSVPMNGDARILHITDVHGQLFPVHFREPNVNLGLGGAYGQLPHVVGKRLLDQMGFEEGSREAYAYTYLDFDNALKKYGRMGGFAHVKTLLDQLRDQAGGQQNTLTLDGGDLWQGSATSLWTRGIDMVEASNILGLDVMVGHWEFTYKEDEVLNNVTLFKGDFIGQNVKVKDESLFEDAYPALVEKYDGTGLYDESSGHAFQPYVIKEVNGARICIVGQAFPRTANANPQEFFPDWSFGLREDEMIELVENIHADEKPDAVVLLSHNGMDVDLKMAENIPGLNAVFGGHTHDGMPKPVEVNNVSGGKCLVTNAGSHGKFVGVMDFSFDNSKVKMDYKMLPVFEDMLAKDKEMDAYLTQMMGTTYDENIVESRRKEYFFNPTRVGKSFKDILDEKLAIAGETLYRRGNFMGTWDQVLCDALNDEFKSDMSLSAGVRWGTSVPKGEWITMGDMMTQCAITYGETYARPMKGSDIAEMLEGIADNLFTKDPYLQSGGDMVRIGGVDYTINPTKDKDRLSDITFDNTGEALDPEKDYLVSGWATVGEAPKGRLIWDIVRDYIIRARDENNVLHLKKINTPKLVGVSDNPGLADYIGESV
ncbi:MAG: 5'-nucleotidase C-terminal domain-containing protein [Arenicellales bacterium]